MKNSIKDFLFYLILGLLFGAALLIMGVGYLIPVSNARLSQQWPAVAGEVSLSRVVDMEVPSGRFGTTIAYSAEIAYQYTVGDRHYTGTNITFNDHSNINSSLAEKIVRRYPTGKTVKVYYNPGNPGEAVLENGFTSNLELSSGFGALLSLVGGAIMIFFLRVAFLVWRGYLATKRESPGGRADPGGRFGWRGNLATKRESPDSTPGALN